MILHVFYNGDDLVVGASAEDAKFLMIEEMGHSAEEIAEFDQWPDDKELTLRYEDAEDAPEGRMSCRQTCAEWIKENGRGYLGGESF